MSRKRRKAPVSPPIRSRRRWWLLAIPILIAAGITVLAATPGSHGWQSLGNNFGRIRWVETVSGPLIEPPLAPEWVRRLRKAGIPWPTDLPLEPSGASFGSPGGGMDQTAAWYLIETSYRPDEFWHVDKRSSFLVDVNGKQQEWQSGGGSSRIDERRHTNYLWVRVPKELSNTGARLHLHLQRFEGTATKELVLPF